MDREQWLIVFFLARFLCVCVCLQNIADMDLASGHFWFTRAGKKDFRNKNPFKMYITHGSKN